MAVAAKKSAQRTKGFMAQSPCFQVHTVQVKWNVITSGVRAAGRPTVIASTGDGPSINTCFHSPGSFVFFRGKACRFLGIAPVRRCRQSTYCSAKPFAADLYLMTGNLS